MSITDSIHFFEHNLTPQAKIEHVNQHLEANSIQERIDTNIQYNRLNTITFGRKLILGAMGGTALTALIVGIVFLNFSYLKTAGLYITSGGAALTGAAVLAIVVLAIKHYKDKHFLASIVPGNCEEVTFSMPTDNPRIHQRTRENVIWNENLYQVATSRLGLGQAGPCTFRAQREARDYFVTLSGGVLTISLH